MSKPECTCDGIDELIVHDGDCPRRCTYWERAHQSNEIAQCERVVGHASKHSLNLYRGSPSVRSGRGQVWPVPEPVCTDLAAVEDHPCVYYYLHLLNSCSLQAGHRERHSGPGIPDNAL